MTVIAMNSKAGSAPQGMKTFLVIWIGQLISLLGSGITSFALGVWIFDQTGKATPFALTILFGNLPRILLLPVAGSLADRWNRRRVMILSDVGNALVTISVFVLLLFGSLQFWHIYLIVTLGSIFSAFQEPAYMASVTMLVPKKDLSRANGMMQMGQALEMIITPVIAGVLFVAIGLSGILVIDFVTFLFAVGALLLVHIPQPNLTEHEEKKASVWEDAKFGWNYLKARPGLFGLLWYFAMVNFLLNWAGVLIGPMILSRFNAGTLGTIQMVVGIGMLAGGILSSVWAGPRRKITAVIGYIGFALLGMIVAGLQPSPVFVGVGLFWLMIFVPLASASSQAVFQSKVAPELQGRVFSIRGMISRSVMPIAFLLAGPLADRMFNPLLEVNGAWANTFLGTLLGTGAGRGIGLMFVISAITGILVTLFVYANPRIRNIEDELPDAMPVASAQTA
ncbi:MAG TPA: MFS transporter [Anaerolineales bacterium]|nr:MFS transporter [Anaerolineales bacterium]